MLIVIYQRAVYNRSRRLQGYLHSTNVNQKESRSINGKHRSKAAKMGRIRHI